MESPHIDRMRWFLILFFVFVDVLPILFKGLTPAGPYDARLRLAEFKSACSVRAKRVRLEADHGLEPASRHGVILGASSQGRYWI